MATQGYVITERIRGQRVVKPIIYGNTALILPQKLPNNHTHQWRLYLRSYNNDELGKYIRKVQFRLHESYPNQLRIVESPPFELTETGWGEFEAQVTAFYYLRLFQPLVQLSDGSMIVQKEVYDEIVFNEPTEHIYRALQQNTGKGQKDNAHFQQVRRRLLEQLELANTEITLEINDLRESLKLSNEFINDQRRLLDSDAIESMDIVPA